MNPNSVFRHSETLFPIMMNDAYVRRAGSMERPGISGGQVVLWNAGLSGWSGGAPWLFRWSFAWGSGSLQGGEWRRGGKKMRVSKRLLELDRKMGWEREKRAIRSVRWQNNMTSHWASLRLAPLRGTVVRQRAANDVLKVKPCAGLMGPEGSAAVDAVVH